MDIFLRTRERAQPHTHPSCTVQKHRKTCNMLMNARTRTTKHTSPNVRGQWQECGAGGPCVLSLVYNHPVTSVPLFLLRSLRLFLTQPVESLFPWWGCEVGLLCLALLSRSVKEAPTKRRTFFLLTLLTVTYAARLPCSLSDYMCNRRRRKAKTGGVESCIYIFIYIPFHFQKSNRHVLKGVEIPQPLLEEPHLGPYITSFNSSDMPE